MLWFVVLICAAHVIYALQEGTAYPFGPGWLPVSRKEQPLGYWAAVGMFTFIGIALAVVAITS